MPSKRSHQKRKTDKTRSDIGTSSPGIKVPVWLCWLDEGKASWSGIIFGALAFFIPWVLYLTTGMREPGIHGDYVKFAVIGKVWGIPHPSGFPLYLMLDGIVSLLPIGTLTFRVMTLSATCVALATHLIYRIGRQLGFSSIVAICIALLAATGRSVWFQAVIPEVYALHLLLMIAPTWALFRWDETDDDRWMWAAIWLYVLSMGNHLTAIFALPGLIIFPIVRKPRIFLRGWTWVHIASAILVTLALYGYLLWRSMYEPLHNEGHIAGELGRLWYHVTGKDYAEEWSHYDSAAKREMWDFFVQLGKQALTPAGWFAAWAGIVAASVLNWRRAIPLVLVPIGLAYSNFLYHTTEPESYFAACFPYAALLVGSLALLPASLADRFIPSPTNKDSAESITSIGIRTIVAVLLIVAIVSHIGTNRNEVNLSGPNQDYARATSIITAIETPSVVYTSNYLHTMLLRYCIWGDEVRDDGPITTTQTWNPSNARQQLTGGIHVYVYAENAPLTRNQFQLRPIATGTRDPELFELSLLPGS